MLTGESQCEDAKGDQFFFLIELLRLDMDPTLAHFVMKGEQLGHSLTLSSQLNTVGYIQMAPRSHSALYLYVPDPLVSLETSYHMNADHSREEMQRLGYTSSIQRVQQMLLPCLQPLPRIGFISTGIR